MDPDDSQNTALLNRFLKNLRRLIPYDFDPKFTSPCWYPKKGTRALLEKLGVHSNPLLCLPKVYFMGFPKSGTTQLFGMMMKHPDIVAGQKKEPHWWTWTDHSANFKDNYMDILEYVNFFNVSSEYIQGGHPRAYVIDGSQSTSFDTHLMKNFCFLPEVLANMFPGAKFILLMRDPTERVYSDFKFFYTLQFVKSPVLKGMPKPVEDNITKIFHEGVVREIADMERCLELRSLDRCCHHMLNRTREREICMQEPCYEDYVREYIQKTTDNMLSEEDIPKSHVRITISLYHVFIRRWLRVFPREQFLFLTTDELSESPLQLLSKVWHFLGVKELSEEDLGKILHKQRLSSVSTHKPMQEETRELLNEFYQPHNDALAELLNESKFNW